MTAALTRLHTNARMSEIVETQRLVYLCGQASGGLDIADITGQTREVLSRDRSTPRRGRLLPRSHPAGDDQSARHGRFRRDQRRLGGLDAGGERSGPDYRGGEARHAEFARRDHGESAWGIAPLMRGLDRGKDRERRCS